ncbi:MAG: esterase/lipase family protein [Lysobacterales bacterium]
MTTAAKGRGKAASHLGDDLRGASRLAIDAVSGVTSIVESMHRNISGLAPALGKPRQGPTKGIAGLVYRSVRGVSRLVGHGLDAGLQLAKPLLAGKQPPPIRDAVVAALNGVFGDHLDRSANPLAIPMQFRHGAQALELDAASLSAALPNPGPHLLLMLHGLCMNDRQWRREGHDHGAALAQELGYTPVYLHYNSGRHVAENGRELSAMLEQLVAAWPQPLESLTLLGHSMGGLVARSAVRQASASGHGWTEHLRAMLFLGTPHHGAPLERAGSWADALIGLSPYSAPLLKLGESRSAGIKDLRFGRLIDRQSSQDRHRDTRALAPLPPDVRCYAVAATRAPAAEHRRRWPGDGLVPVASALGEHRDPRRSLAFPEDHRWIAHECGHFDLLSRADVYARMRGWLAAERSAG